MLILPDSLFLAVAVGSIALAVMILASNHAVTKLIGIASYFDLSSTFMGMTVVSIATSLPEIVAHFTASVRILAGRMDYKTGSAIVLGSNIGSDVVQQTLIFGLVVFLAGSLTYRRYFIWKNMIPMVGTTVLCILLGLDGTYSRIDGAILFGCFILYSFYLYQDERKFYNKDANQIQDEDVAAGVPTNGKEVVRDILIAILMLLLTIAGASVVLQLTERIVNETGIAGSLIGVVTLGLASALPELTTAIVGIQKKEAGISLGTLVGSNIVNPLLAIGGGALISGYAVPLPLVRWDLPWETLTGAILWLILLKANGKIGKKVAVYLMIIYFMYIVSRAFLFRADF